MLGTPQPLAAAGSPPPPIRNWHQLSGQAAVAQWRANLMAARWAVPTSPGTVAWGSGAASALEARARGSLAAWSARLLPSMPEWDGTNCRWNWRNRTASPVHTAAPIEVFCVAGPSLSVASAAWEPVQKTTGALRCHRWSR